MEAVIFLAGIIIGLLVGFLLFRKPFAGTLQIIDDEEGTYLSAVLEHDVSYIRKKKHVTMAIRELSNPYYGETINLDF